MSDKTYVQHLTKGGELLRADKLPEARAELERANQLRPGDQRILNLLGLACFRLGDYTRARTIYNDLVGRQPEDAALRLNLGLVFLKMGAADDAIRELAKAKELDPKGGRTDGYLGLAYARKGEFAKARDAFKAAGQDELVREMEEELRKADAGGPTNGKSAEPAAAVQEALDETSGPVLDPSAVGAEIEEETTGAERMPDAQDTSAEAARSAAATVAEAEGHRAPIPVSAFAVARLIRPDDGDLPFELAAGGTLIVRVRGRLMARTEGIIVTGGELAYEAAVKRVRGRLTEEPFGSESRPLFIVSGTGHLIVAPNGNTFTALELQDDIVYLREDFVFAFEEHLGWENGHVPGSAASIDVVQFRGAGCVVMRTRKAPITVKLAPDKLLLVDANVLAGWIGRVVPRVVTPAGGGESSVPFVECSGEGVVLLEEPASPDEAK